MNIDLIYETTHTGEGFVMATGSGFLFSALYRDGITKAVAYDKLSDGKFRYTVGKKSDLVPGFPVGPASVEGTILYELNEAEPGWGGGSSIGGGPREGSKLTPDEVFAIVEKILKG